RPKRPAATGGSPPAPPAPPPPPDADGAPPPQEATHHTAIRTIGARTSLIRRPPRARTLLRNRPSGMDSRRASPIAMGQRTRAADWATKSSATTMATNDESVLTVARSWRDYVRVLIVRSLSLAPL